MIAWKKFASMTLKKPVVMRLMDSSATRHFERGEEMIYLGTLIRQWANERKQFLRVFHYSKTGCNYEVSARIAETCFQRKANHRRD